MADGDRKNPHYIVINVQETKEQGCKYLITMPLFPGVSFPDDSKEEGIRTAKLFYFESCTKRDSQIPDHIIFVTPDVFARATEINGAMVVAEHWRHGLTKELPNVEQYGLLEMVLAAPMVKAVEAADPNRTTRAFVCADRLVAALFAVNHHSAGPASDANIITFNQTRALACVYTSELKDEDEDEDEDEDADDEAPEDK